jgi:hypothetical protein
MFFIAVLAWRLAEGKATFVQDSEKPVYYFSAEGAFKISDMQDVTLTLERIKYEGNDRPWALISTPRMPDACMPLIENWTKDQVFPIQIVQPQTSIWWEKERWTRTYVMRSFSKDEILIGRYKEASLAVCNVNILFEK